MSIITRTKAIKTKTLLVVSRDDNLAITHALKWVTHTAKNPLVVCFGSPEVFSSYDLAIAQLTVDNLDNQLRELATEIKAGGYDAILMDSVSFLRRLMIADVGGTSTPTLQEYGLINQRLFTSVCQLRGLTPIFAATAAFVKNDESGDWELDLTSNLIASLSPLFGSINYITRSKDEVVVQEERDLAIEGKSPRVAPVAIKKKL